MPHLGEIFLEYQMTGKLRERRGNRHPHMAPHGCYRCAGDDKWVTIAVRNEGEWGKFCKATGMTHLADDERFGNLKSRLQNQDELDEIISRWTSSQSQYQVMEALQSAGVPAGPVLNAKALLADPQFRARGFFHSEDHPIETGLGRQEYVGRGWSLSEVPIEPTGPAPMLGEANDYVLRRILGLGDEEIQGLKDAGTVGEKLADAQVPSTVPLERQVELGWISGYDGL